MIAWDIILLLLLLCEMRYERIPHMQWIVSGTDILASDGVFYSQCLGSLAHTFVNYNSELFFHFFFLFLFSVGRHWWSHVVEFYLHRSQHRWHTYGYDYRNICNELQWKFIELQIDCCQFFRKSTETIDKFLLYIRPYFDLPYVELELFCEFVKYIWFRQKSDVFFVFHKSEESKVLCNRQF